jgi:predicted secreted Zn-dependent protease
VTAPPTASTDTVATDGAALVKVPRNLKVKVPGATKIRYFDVRGDTPDDILLAATEASERLCVHPGAVACALQQWNAQALPRTNPRTGACTVAAARTILDSTVWVPRWVANERVTPNMLAWWKQVLRKIAKHEAKHVAIQRSGLARYRRQVIGKPCSAIQSLVQRTNDAINAAQVRWDERDADTPWPEVR